jgi:hypothetical protein
MGRSETIPIILVSALLIIYATLILFQKWLLVAYSIYLISPLAIVWLVYQVIRNGKYNGRELQENEEWGYADTDKPHSVVIKNFPG